MSTIHIPIDQKEALKNIVYKLQNTKLSLGHIHLIHLHKKYKRIMINYTKIPTDIINIIYEYTPEIINVSVILSMFYINQIDVIIKLDNIIELIFKFATYDISEVKITNIKSNIFNYFVNNPSTHEDYDNEEAFIHYSCNYVSDKKSDESCWKNKMPEFEDVNINYFFNSYMEYYYNKNNYLQLEKNEYEYCKCVKYYSNNIFVNISQYYDYNKKYVFIYPLDHKKIKKIIVMTKVIKTQLDKIMKEIFDNTQLSKTFFRVE